jgi:methylenetetrahydrofolate dehydrogenase (NADP+) / methenyltetrahydrofolate cyclohydrolase
MTAKIIDGKLLAAEVRSRVKTEVDGLIRQGMRPPMLSVLLVGDDPASEIYVSYKEKACQAAGIATETIRLSSQTSQKQLHQKLQQLNHSQSVDGILLQLPLPPQLNKMAAIAMIEPSKDVDGLTPMNQGRMLWQAEGLYPCTPLGVVELIKSTGIKLNGAVAAIVGRSLLVGMPVGQLLEVLGCTVIGLHSETDDVAQWTRQADIIVVATGAHKLLKADWVRPGAVVIDVGIHRVDNHIEGDVCFDEVREVAGHITPVPGGVGPMTIAMLLQNVVKAHADRL